MSWFIKRSACISWSFRVPPSPVWCVSRHRQSRDSRAYHLECVQFLLDLLRKHWCQAVAGGNLSPTIIFPTRPCVMELDARAESSVPLPDRGRSSRQTFRVSSEPQSRHEVVFAAERDRPCTSVSLWVTIRGARGRRVWRVIS